MELKSDAVTPSSASLLLQTNRSLFAQTSVLVLWMKGPKKKTCLSISFFFSKRVCPSLLLSFYSDFFSPVAPTKSALYLLNDSASQHDLQVVWLGVGFESASDVHLRNTMILQTYPQYLYFRSLRTAALSISSYEEFRSDVENIDYSRFKQRCRQKFIQETVTKTLVVKGSVILTDLTDEVIIMGNAAVAAGSFSDVWKGTWEDPIEERPRTVALKFLRLVMVQNV